MKNPLEEVLKLVQAHEMRIDYNFNSLLQLSMLVEYLYEQLAVLNIEIDMSGFEEFQNNKVKEIENNFEKIKDDPEVQEKIMKEFESNYSPSINISDD